MSNLQSYKPKVLLLAGNRGSWQANGKVLEDTLANGVEAWVYTFDGTYNQADKATISEINNYDIVIGNSNGEKCLANLIKLAEGRSAKVRWITMIEGDAYDYLSPNNNYLRLFDSSDLINCINIHSLEYFRKLTTTKVEYIGIPYPFEKVASYRIRPEKRDKKVFICPHLLERKNDYLVAKQIGMKYTGWEMQTSRALHCFFENMLKYYKLIKTSEKPIKDTIINSFNKYKIIDYTHKIYGDTELEIQRSVVLDDFFRTYGSYYLWVNMDNRYTWGRYVLDAAALGIPIITTKQTGHGVNLYPETCLDNCFEIDKAVEISKKLINDYDYYKNISEYPIGKMEYLRSSIMREKLLNALNNSN